MTPTGRLNAGIITTAAFLLLAGCLPSSCQRSESTRLLPADSLSRELAASAPVDTLRLVWSTAALNQEQSFAYPRTVRFGRGDSLYVTDVQRNSVFIVDGAGEVLSEIQLSGVEVPYLAGIAGDTISLFSPVSTTFYRLHKGNVVDSTLIDDPGREKSSLVYGAAAGNLFYKRIDPENPGFIAAYSQDGVPKDTSHLAGPHWRYAGLLKTWGDTLASFSGFRPVVDLVLPAARGTSTVDTLALVGFDSPMLARSRSFMRGEVHEAPLLASSAAPAGDQLFVLNLRAGWLQVDVFGRDGVLQHRLVQPDENYRSEFFPQDLDVRRRDHGYEIAVVFSQPDPTLSLFSWTPSALPVLNSDHATTKPTDADSSHATAR